MEQTYFPGHERAKKIQVIESGGIKSVIVNRKVYMTWASWDTASQRMVIAQLYTARYGTQQDLSLVFGIHINTVQKYVADFTRDGLEGLITQRGGPRGRWKLTPGLRAKILILALKEGILGYEAIQERLELWHEHVSIPSIRQVLLENGFVHERVSVGDVEVKQTSFFDPRNDGQLQLPFTYEATSDKGSEIDLEVKRNRIENVEVNSFAVVQPPRALRYYSHGQRRYLNQLERGYYNAYAGGLLFAPLMEQCSFLPTLKQVINIPTYEGYSLEELCVTLFYFDVFSFRSMEDFKRVYPEEFGLLIGRSYSPSLYTLRRFLHKVRELDKSEKLIDEFALMYLKSGIAKWGVLYIDGHFLPYYGVYPITKGWHGVRKIPLKGSYNFIGVDNKFTPWIFLVRSSSEDLLQKIPEILEKAKKIGRDIGLSDEVIDDLILVFDREGYSAKLYRFLDGKDRKDKKRRAIFISWAKYSDKWVNEVAEEKFDKGMKVQYEIQDSKDIKYFETKRAMSKYGVIRAIVIQSVKNDKRSVIYTNAKDTEIGPEKIIELLCNRWGEENLIKELLIKHLIDYSPGYVTEALEEQPMVDNPKIKELKKEKAGRVTELHKLKLQLANWVLEQTEKAGLKDLKKTKIQLLADIVGIDNEILLINQEIDKTPTKIRFDQANDGEKLLKLNYEKKRFLDCIKVFVYNMEKKMCELLANYYDKKKELLPALSMIVDRGGHIKLERGQLRVQLKRFMNSEIDYAARHICEDLNRMNPVTLDKHRLPIHYEVL
ncbi:MAG: helix-turn-helix domain-containing protein [Deltaproteobacteria bacterium]|nr:helix-turn-helix domain-containing protein [Deltaproteobacteria bacterium]